MKASVRSDERQVSFSIRFLSLLILAWSVTSISLAQDTTKNSWYSEDHTVCVQTELTELQQPAPQKGWNVYRLSIQDLSWEDQVEKRIIKLRLSLPSSAVWWDRTRPSQVQNFTMAPNGTLVWVLSAQDKEQQALDLSLTFSSPEEPRFELEIEPVNSEGRTEPNPG